MPKATDSPTEAAYREYLRQVKAHWATVDVDAIDLKGSANPQAVAGLCFGTIGTAACAGGCIGTFGTAGSAGINGPGGEGGSGVA